MDVVAATSVALSLIGAVAGLYAAACARTAARGARATGRRAHDAARQARQAARQVGAIPNQHAVTKELLGCVIESLGRVHASFDVLAKLMVDRKRENMRLDRVSDEPPPSSTRRR